MIRTVLMIAMEQEAAPIVDAIGAKPLPVCALPLPVRLHSAKLDGQHEVIIAVNGKDDDHQVDCIGTQPAAVTSYYALSRFQPDLVVNAGTAGSLVSGGVAVGDVFVGYPRLAFHDRRIPLPGFDLYGRGDYATPDTRSLAERLNARTAIVSTGNSLDHTDRDIEMMRDNGGVVKDMEAASIGWICALHKTPLIVIKAITDLIDAPTAVPEQFAANLATASQGLCQTVVRLLEIIQDSRDIDSLWSV